MSNLWFQLVSSRAKVPQMFAALETIGARVKHPDTTFEVHGTAVGGFADPWDAFLHLDGAELIRLAMAEFPLTRADAYGLVNSLDPAIKGLRQVLDVPVVALMEVACSMSRIWGDRFGLLVPNRQMVPLYRDLIESYGLAGRLAGIEPLPIDAILAYHRIYQGDPTLTERAMQAAEDGAQRLVEQGADLILAPGPLNFYLEREGITDIAGARFVHSFSLLLKVTEGVATLAQHGLTTSRTLRYSKPPAALYADALAAYTSPNGAGPNGAAALTGRVDAVTVTYTVRHRVAPEDVAEWARWQTGEHVPSLLVLPGYLGMQRFEEVGTPGSFLNVWRIATRAAHGTPEFKQATFTPWYERVRHLFQAEVHFSTEAEVGQPGGTDAWRESVRGLVVDRVGSGAAASDRARADEALIAHARTMAGGEGVVRVIVLTPLADRSEESRSAPHVAVLSYVEDSHRQAVPAPEHVERRLFRPLSPYLPGRSATAEAVAVHGGRSR